MFEPAAHCTICLTDFSLEDERQKENFAIFPCGACSILITERRDPLAFFKRRKLVGSAVNLHPQ